MDSITSALRFLPRRQRVQVVADGLASSSSFVLSTLQLIRAGAPLSHQKIEIEKHLDLLQKKLKTNRRAIKGEEYRDEIDIVSSFQELIMLEEATFWKD